MTDTIRIKEITRQQPQLAELIANLLVIACKGLPLMFDHDQKKFFFTRKIQSDHKIIPQGSSIRYGAITLLGAFYLDEQTQRTVFGGESGTEFLTRTINGLNDKVNFGDLSLVTWAAAMYKHPLLEQVRKYFFPALNSRSNNLTVESAWALSALVRMKDSVEASNLCQKLLNIFSEKSGIFPHYLNPDLAPWYRRHVGCFADQVYPIQALSMYHRAFGFKPALDAAARCANQICKCQGPAGQWYWHYDARTGDVIEQYPVYTVHQDSMAPMALFDLYEAGGPNHLTAITKGLGWMNVATEVQRSLVDQNENLIWRSVKRQEPRRLTRVLKSFVTSVSKNSRLKFLDTLFPPTRIDFEDRPYHLGWILYAWLKR